MNDCANICQITPGEYFQIWDFLWKIQFKNNCVLLGVKISCANNWLIDLLVTRSFLKNIFNGIFLPIIPKNKSISR